LITINVPGFMSSPQCAFGTTGGSTSMNPVDKWWISMLFPFILAAGFAVWYKCAGSDKFAKKTISDMGMKM
jgi:hypothetical protein